MKTNRRDFLGGALASVGLWGIGGCRLFPASAPEFAAGAKIATREVKARPSKPPKGVTPVDVAALEVRFPAANAGGARPFTYEIAVSGEGEAKLVRGVIAEGFDQPGNSLRTRSDSVAVLALSSLPKGASRTISVTPVSSLGVRGRSLQQRM